MSEDDKKAKPAKGLGRGLAALLRDEPDEAPRSGQGPASGPPAPAPAAAAPAAAPANPELEALRREAVTLPVEFLRPGKFQPRKRFDETALDQLATSLAEKGMLQPIVVRAIPGRKDAYEILAGERRWRAAQRAKLHDVPVVLRDFSDRDALEIALVENLQRQDLSAMEEAEGYQRLKQEFGATQEELAGALGKSRSHIANTLRLLELPSSVRRLLDEGRLSAGHARAIAASPDVEQLAIQIAEQGLSVRDAERLAQHDSRGPRPAKARKNGAAGGGGATARLSADAQALRRRLEEALGLKVELAVKPNSEATSVTLHCTDYEQLDEVARRLERPPGRG